MDEMIITKDMKEMWVGITTRILVLIRIESSEIIFIVRRLACE